MDPVPDPLLHRKSGSAGNRTRDLCICSQKLCPLDHRGGLLHLELLLFTQSFCFTGLKLYALWTSFESRTTLEPRPCHVHAQTLSLSSYFQKIFSVLYSKKQSRLSIGSRIVYVERVMGLSARYSN